MPLGAQMVGETTKAIQHHVDARWLMAYAAGVGDSNPLYLDTTGSLIAHPVFSVCLEWPSQLQMGQLPGFETVTAQEASKGVHASHDIHIHRPIKAEDSLTVKATVIGLRRIKSGAEQTLCLDTVDRQDNLVSRSFQKSIYRGVEVTGDDKLSDLVPNMPVIKKPHWHEPPIVIPVPTLAAHWYTECSRIWNPIHTDRAVAISSGLPDSILHGTATLAMVTTGLVDKVLAGDGSRVFRLGGRFTGMVFMPSTLNVYWQKSGDNSLLFEVRNDQGAVVFSDGYMYFHIGRR